MEMHQIRYFLAVAETLNFTRAAEACNVAQPSLSRAIQKLEEELGGDLFRRERSHTHLTDLGRNMAPLLRRAFESAAAAKEQAARYKRAEHAPLRLGISQTVPLETVGAALAELTRALPGLELRITRAPARRLGEALKAGDVELCLAAGLAEDWGRLDRWPLFDEGFVLLSRDPDGRAGIAIEDIPADGRIERPYCENRDLLGPDEGDGGHTHSVACEEDAVGLVEMGLGVALMPESAARASPGHATPVDGDRARRTVEVYGAAGRQRSPAASTLLTLLRAADWTAAPPS